ncbi:hypothetical protein [uncultured Neptuniibacter sp.]|uniref:hypothetical protein n=1 Tax=uncultured Neptuniibacter sp. TaxID=502143 RepID=UPI00262CE5BF|nr:hypothetical protein [uncultured Neptuniibacter sp.]
MGNKPGLVALCFVVLSLCGLQAQAKLTASPAAEQSLLKNERSFSAFNGVEVRPLTLNLSANGRFSPYTDYLIPLLTTLSEQSLYRIKNGRNLLRSYHYKGRIYSPDKQKTVLSMQDSRSSRWGYVITSIGRQGVANAFMLERENGERQYALVIKQMKICLVSQARSAPVWRSGQWSFSQQPGYFECSGSTRSSFFRVSSGFPQKLGPYYSDTDTLLVFDRSDQLKSMARALKEQFPQLSFPKVLNLPTAVQRYVQLN